MFFLANWKMYGSRAQVSSIIEALAKSRETTTPHTLVICPPYPYIPQLKESDLGVGAQDCATHEEGAYTGDVSAKMLAEIGCTHVILGHSERRRNHGERIEEIAAKVQQAIAHNLMPVVCVGEPNCEYDSMQAVEFILTELDELGLAQCSLPGFVAYEPVWAIGTGLVPKAEVIEAIASAISKHLPGWKVLYGGSVRSSNIEDLRHIKTIDGFLVGSASQDAQEMLAIIKACGE